MTIDKHEFYQLEHSTLRNELNNLKSCQVTFISLSVTGTGVILGIINAIENQMEKALYALIPLIILIPFWFIFFDKAHTITRIVGYYRILEKLMLNPTLGNNFIGWENALAKFRKHPDMEYSDKTDSQSSAKSSTEESNPKSKSYWVFVYIIFLGLSIICILPGNYYYPIISCNFRPEFIVVKLACGIGLFSGIYNSIVLWSLTRGKYSYTYNEKKWHSVIEVEENPKD